MNRRQACKAIGSALLASPLAAQRTSGFQLNYVLSSALYGEMLLETILPEIEKAGCQSIDIWRRKHGNQREQITEMGDAACLRLIKEHNAKISVSSCYPLGPQGLQEEMVWLQQYGGKVIVTGSGRYPDSEPTGSEAKAQVKKMLEIMKPHVAKAEETGITIALENHSKQLLYHPDSLRYFAEFNKSPHLGIAFAPHHLYKFENEIPSLLRDIGDFHIPFMYFQEHSEGIYEKVPKEIEMQQLPGYGGGLDYRPIISALRDIRYTGLVEIFMHPVPRGIPILPTVSGITAAINKSRRYIDKCIKQTA
jgi:sugar phosphate isomerase/epimerase